PSVQVSPLSSEKPQPTAACWSGSQTPRESLNAATTTLPATAIDVSLWISPRPFGQRVRSLTSVFGPTAASRLTLPRTSFVAGPGIPFTLGSTAPGISPVSPALPTQASEGSKNAGTSKRHGEAVLTRLLSMRALCKHRCGSCCRGVFPQKTKQPEAGGASADADERVERL